MFAAIVDMYMDSAGRQLSLQSVYIRAIWSCERRTTHTHESYTGYVTNINFSSRFERAPAVLFAPSAKIHTIGSHVACLTATRTHTLVCCLNYRHSCLQITTRQSSC